MTENICECSKDEQGGGRFACRCRLITKLVIQTVRGWKEPGLEMPRSQCAVYKSCGLVSASKSLLQD